MMRCMFFLYEALLWLLFLFVFPIYAMAGLVSGKRRIGLRERFGFYRKDPGRHDLWIHAVSVGETVAAATILDHIRNTRPGLALLVTTTTATGQETAKKRFPTATITWFPFDLRFSVRRFLEHHNPRLCVTMETEIWPNMAVECHRRGIRLIMANGRISDRSLPRYRRIRPFVRRVLGLYDLILAREDLDRRRFLEIGAPEQIVEVGGNVKFDHEPQDSPLPFEADLERLRSGRPLFVAGSTMEGEEEKLLPVIRALIDRGVFVIVAPRKPDRFDAVARLFEREQIGVVRRSTLGRDSGDGDLLLLDSIGELSRAYRGSIGAFIGGSLVPIGGHNPIEASAVGVPVAFGPHMSNFREIATTLLASGAAVQVDSARALLEWVERLRSDPEEQRRLSRLSSSVIARNRGAAQATADRVAEFLE